MNAPAAGSSRARRWLALAALLCAFAWSAGTRIYFTLSDPGFRGATAAQLLRTDPALLYYVSERIADAGGVLPSELRADPNLEWPEVTDIAAIETLGQEFVVAWTWLAAGKPLLLHHWAVWVMGLWISLTVVGVFGAAWELSRRWEWAAAGALLWAAMQIDYRTLGFVLVREDFAFPWIAAHLWLALRAVRTRRVADYVLAGLTMLAAAAFWHASLFVLAMEAVAVLAWFLRSGDNPFAAPRAGWVLAVPALLSLAVPVLRAKQFALSLPMLVGWALLLTHWSLRGAQRSHAHTTLRALVSLAVLVGLSKLVATLLGGGIDDYSHVFKLLLAKVQHLGTMPADPRGLDFEVRLLWQGPFRTADWGTLITGAWAGFLVLTAATMLSWKAWRQGRGDGALAVALFFALACAFSSWMVERTAPLLGMATAMLAASVLSRVRAAAWLVTLAIAAHGAHQLYMPATYAIGWYQIPPSKAENAHVLEFIATNVPQGEALASDYSTSAAVLAFARRPVLNQPKYETRRSRERVEQFCRAVYAGSSVELADYLRSQRCRWLLINRAFIGGNATDLGGILPADLPHLGQRALLALMSDNPAHYRQVGPLRLVYEAPPGLGGQAYRLYRLD